MERAELESMDRTEGQSDCKAGRAEKSKPGAEKFKGVAEKTGNAEVLPGTGLKGCDRVSATTLSEPEMWRMSLVNFEM